MIKYNKHIQQTYIFKPLKLSWEHKIESNEYENAVSLCIILSINRWQRECELTKNNKKKTSSEWFKKKALEYTYLNKKRAYQNLNTATV